MSPAVQKVRNRGGSPDVASWTDEQLLLDYRDTRERASFEELVHRYERELYSYLRRYLGDSEVAEDVFQATFLQLHLKCKQFESGRKLRPWLYTIATNQAIDAQRRNRRHRIASLDRITGKNNDDLSKLLDLMASSEANPAAEADLQESRTWVRRALRDLPEHLRSVVTLVYYQGMKYREAADTLSIPVGTVKSRMHAAVLKLNEAWNSTRLQQN
jgi:RNA polymerase sigma-70 factor (ECF subfamily)